MVIVELRERSTDPQAGIWIGLHRRWIEIERIRAAMGCPALIAAEHVVSDAEQIRAERCPRFIAVDAFEQRDEGVLRQLLRARGLGDPTPEEMPDRPTVAIEQCFERLAGAPASAQNEFVVRHRSLNDVVSREAEKFPVARAQYVMR